MGVFTWGNAFKMPASHKKAALLGGEPVRRGPFPSWPIFSREEESGLLRVLHSGNWGRLDGQEVVKFEERFAEMHGCKYGIAVVNGTVSLRIALLAAGIRAEDEVVVPSYTFFSTASAVVESNAVPVFADVDLGTFNLDPKAIERVITRRTRAIIPVHFAGLPADMDKILAIAKRHKLLVIEDAAHAQGASYKRKPAGSLAHIGSSSFQSSKNLTAGEGGIITTNDKALVEKCRSIQNCGRIPEGVWYEHHLISGNYRLSEFQGAVLNAQLSRLERQTKRRDNSGQYLASKISSLPGVHPQRRPKDCTRHSHHLFMARIDPELFGISRDLAVRALEAEGIPCSAGYGFSLHHQPVFQKNAFGPFLPLASKRLNYSKTHCPNSDLICRQSIWLSHNLLLGSRADMDDIANAFRKIFENRGALNQWANKYRKKAKPT